jgi:hypothetical protein
MAGAHCNSRLAVAEAQGQFRNPEQREHPLLEASTKDW